MPTIILYAKRKYTQVVMRDMRIILHLLSICMLTVPKFISIAYTAINSSLFSQDFSDFSNESQQETSWFRQTGRLVTLIACCVSWVSTGHLHITASPQMYCSLEDQKQIYLYFLQNCSTYVTYLSKFYHNPSWRSCQTPSLYS